MGCHREEVSSVMEVRDFLKNDKSLAWMILKDKYKPRQAANKSSFDNYVIKGLSAEHCHLVIF